jgi:hypothetical protein
MARLHFTMLIICFACGLSVAGISSKQRPVGYVTPRPTIAGLHVGMTADSAELVMRKIGLRVRTLHLDSLTLFESDSVRVFGEAAYLRVDLLKNKVRTLVVNFHPLSGDHYINLRNLAAQYLEGYFGRGVITKDQSVVYRRWETADGTMEASFTDKYLRVFMRLGKHQ